jgi:hypothetical protein
MTTEAEITNVTTDLICAQTAPDQPSIFYYKSDLGDALHWQKPCIGVVARECPLEAWENVCFQQVPFDTALTFLDVQSEEVAARESLRTVESPACTTCTVSSSCLAHLLGEALKAKSRPTTT